MLLANSINSWKGMQTHFHKHFYRTELEVTLANLAIIVQDLKEVVKS